MTHDAAVWLANHLEGPNKEAGMFKCFWCGKNAMTHIQGCPFYAASHQLSEEAKG